MSMPPIQSWVEWDNDNPWGQAEYEAAMLEIERKAYENMTMEDYFGKEAMAAYEAEMNAAMNQEQAR